MFTYIATNIINGKFYIGSTTNFKHRKTHHMTSKCKYPFQNSLRLNPEAFRWEVWEDDSSEPILEQALLDMWFGTEQCYNLNPNASIPPNLKGHKFSQKTLEKRAQSRRGKNYGVYGENHPFYGKSHSEKSISSNRETHIGRFWVNNKKEEKSLPKGSDIPEGYTLGRLFNLSGYSWWVNEDNKCMRSLSSPGPNWKRGRKW